MKTNNEETSNIMSQILDHLKATEPCARELAEFAICHSQQTSEGDLLELLKERLRIIVKKSSEEIQ